MHRERWTLNWLLEPTWNGVWFSGVCGVRFDLSKVPQMPSSMKHLAVANEAVLGREAVLC